MRVTVYEALPASQQHVVFFGVYYMADGGVVRGINICKTRRPLKRLWLWLGGEEGFLAVTHESPSWKWFQIIMGVSYYYY